MSTSFLSKLSSVLIASAAILVDLSLRREQTNDRIAFSILLWLTASLQTTQSSIFVHIIFLSCILSSFFTQSALLWHIQRSRAIQIASATHLIAPSAWVSLFVETLSSNTPIYYPILLGLLAFIILLVYQWYRQQKQAYRKELVGIPVVQSYQQLSSAIDERQWYEWKPSQVLEWIRSIDDTDNDNVLVSILAPERIQGRQLHRLNANDLRSLMGVPYGSAMQLMEAIEKLVDEYPPPDNVHRQRRQSEATGWFAQYDQEYNHPIGMDEEKKQSNDDSYNKQSKTYAEAVDPDVEEQARNLMKDRFGLELPEIRRSNDSQQRLSHDETTISDELLLPQQSTLEHPVHATQSLEASQNEPSLPQTKPSVWGSLAPEFLENMPPHISEIARRKPELVQQILASRQKQQANLKPPPPEPDAPNVASMKGQTKTQRPETVQEEASDEESFDQWDDDNSDCERTELLRKRAGVRYKSIQ